jgi:hypothetical protein
MRNLCHARLCLLLLTLALLAAGTALKAESPLSGGGALAAETPSAGGGTLSDRSTIPPQAILFDDFGRSTVCLDFATGSFTWLILQGPGAGNYYMGTGSVLHANGPWQIVYTTPYMTMTAVYVEEIPHGAGGLWVRGGGGGGTKGYPATPPITSAIYDTGKAADRTPQVYCGGDNGNGDTPALPQAETPAAEGAASEAVTSPPEVMLYDDFGRSAVCLDFTTGSFTWNILQGPGAGIYFGGAGTVLHTVGPWQIFYFAPYATMTAVYVEGIPHGAGSLWLAGGGGGTKSAYPASPPITSAMYYTGSEENPVRQGCGYGDR